MDENIVKQFGTLGNFRDFLNEQINDGAEISRGKDVNDMSKEQKRERDKNKKSIRIRSEAEEKKISKEVKKNADGSGTETHYDTSEPEAAPDDGEGEGMVPPTPVVVDPSQAPGSQIAIGRKEKAEADPKAVEIKVSGETNEINLKPKLQKNTNGTK
jgi:hypothetical protein